MLQQTGRGLAGNCIFNPLFAIPEMISPTCWEILTPLGAAVLWAVASCPLRCNADGFPVVFVEVRRSPGVLAVHLCDVLRNNLSSFKLKILLFSNCFWLLLKMSRWKGVSVHGVSPFPAPWIPRSCQTAGTSCWKQLQVQENKLWSHAYVISNVYCPV